MGSAPPRHSQHDGHDGQELAGCRELHAVIHLLPVRQQPRLALVWRLERGSFHGVQEDVHALQRTQRRCEPCLGLRTRLQRLGFSQRSAAVREGGLQQRFAPLEGCAAIAADPKQPRGEGRLRVGPALLRATLLPLLPCVRKGSCEITALGSVGSGDRHGLAAVCNSAAKSAAGAAGRTEQFLSDASAAFGSAASSTLSPHCPQLLSVPRTKVCAGRGKQGEELGEMQAAVLHSAPSSWSSGFIGVFMYFCITRDNTSSPKDLLTAGTLPGRDVDIKDTNSVAVAPKYFASLTRGRLTML